MEPVKLLARAADGAVRVIRHPISSAAYAVGLARGLAGSAIGAVTERRHGEHYGATRPTVPPPRTAPVRAADDVPPPEPAPLGESFATEPKAVTRQSAHGGPGRDAEIDGWLDEATEPGDEPDIVTPVGTTGAGNNADTDEADLQQSDTEPLLDPAIAKAIRSESAMLRKDAERNPE